MMRAATFDLILSLSKDEVAAPTRGLKSSTLRQAQGEDFCVGAAQDSHPHRGSLA
jgi:hypothetical protein